ncbi:ABC transporter ATP-binding protein [Arthrobacter cavernae]|uniref:ABC transporter ATP-binding protein n=1 Tax=Arthrobacter cavernae TaxID=2817681 RepID=A0A939KJL3_9MICC|nr:ABC transporter ATP-binding protein [Arthrobacter cavernae]MBO1268812.1 ABC transporter ATP-binding protein [Arthrobacter cavernae]
MTTATQPAPRDDTALLSAHGLTLGFDGRTVVPSLDVAFARGTVTSVIGPNGCGKSTLLRGLGRLLRPQAGRVALDGGDLAGMSSRATAQRMSILPQTPHAPSGLTVGELVARGRHPRQRWYQQFSHSDEGAIADALAATDIADLAATPLEDLSGGQRQRAWISMILAQETELMLLDEPTTYLDLAHQVDVLELVRRLNQDMGRTVVMVLHDISLAARYSDVIIAMRDGRIVAEGPPSDVITPELLWEVFGLRAEVIQEPTEGRPHVVPLGAGSVKSAAAPGMRAGLQVMSEADA